MSGATILFLLLLLACPLMMIWMMRGGHGAHGGGGHAGHGCGHGGGHDDSHREQPKASIEELRSQRDELDRLIEERESAERVPAAVGAAEGSRDAE